MVGGGKRTLDVFFLPKKPKMRTGRWCTPCSPARLLPLLHPPSMALFLLCRHSTGAPLPPPLRPASRQPLSSSASAAAHLLIVVFLLLSAASLQLPLASKQLLLQLNHRILPAVVLIRLCRRTLIDCCFLSLLSAPLKPLCHRSSIASL